LPVTFDDLIKPAGAEGVRAFLYRLLEAGDFPVSSWQPGSVPRRIVESLGVIGQDTLTLIANLGRGGYLESATGAWLTLLARSFYLVERHAPVFARGIVVLADAAGNGPTVIAPRSLWATSTSGRRFQNVDGGTLPKNGTLPLTWEAESPGSLWNVPANTLNRLSTPLPGVTAINPPLEVGKLAWLSQSGTDEEPDEALRKRCRARWPELGTGTTALVYEAWARTASDEITRLRVFEDAPFNGQVRIVAASAAGTLPPDAQQAVRDYIAPRRTLTVPVSVDSATDVLVSVRATLYVKAAYFADARTAVLDALTAYQATLDIGSPIYRAQLIEELMSPEGAINAVLIEPAVDTPIAQTAIATLVPNITVVAA
jgi:uncharacterized phage protein gp47/JayE